MVMEKNRRLEIYYQFNSATDAQQMDAYMDYPTALGNSHNEKIALRFESDDSDHFRFWGVRTTDDNTEGSLGVAIEGDRDDNKAEIRVVEDNDGTPDTATDLHAAPASCVVLDDDSDSAATGCTAVSAPGSTVHGNDFDIPGTDAVPVETIELLRADAPSYDFGSALAGASTTQTMTLLNVGSADVSSISATGLASPFDFLGGSYPGTGGTCSSSLAAGSSCTLVVEFAPGSASTASDQLVLSYVMGGLNYDTTLDLQGVGTVPSPAVLSISESDPYDFGTVAVGSNSSHTFTVTNSGGQTATSISESGLATPFDFLGGSYPGTGGSCSSILVAGSSCTLVVNFSPTAGGVSTDSIDVSYNDGVAAQSVQRSVSGTGSAGAAVLAISESDPYDFGSVVQGSSASHTFTVTNSGSQAASAISEVGLAAPFAFSGGSYPGTGGTCGASLSAGANCTIQIEFSPTAAVVSNDTVDLSYNDGSSAQNATRNVTGTGITPASLSISESDPYDFGTIGIGGNVNHVFTITNSGSSVATSMSETGLAVPFMFNGGSYPGTSGTCGATLAAGGSCNIEVSFVPVATGLVTDTIVISYNDGGAAQSSSRNIQGTGAAPAVLTISESDPYDFGTHGVGNSSNHIFTVTNSGGMTATSLSGAGLASPFAFNGGAFPGVGGTCASTLAAGSNCTIDVSYSPTVTGLSSDTIEVHYNDGSVLQISSRDVQGTGANPALLVISEADPYDFGSISTGSNGTHTFTVTNTGGATATSIAGSGLAAPYMFMGGAFPGTGGTCGAVIAAAASCDIVIDFSPISTGVFNDTIQVDYNDGTAAQQATRNITGTGI